MTPRTVGVGAALVYAVGLLVSVTSRLTGPFALSPDAVLAPLTQVLSFAAIAAAVWIAHDGGFERLAAGLGNPSHPLFGVVADASLGPDLDLRHATVAALLAAAAGTAGMVLVGGLSAALTTATGTVLGQFGPGAGISAGAAPSAFVDETAFLLAVLFVVGSRPLWGLLKGVVVLFAIQAGVRLLPALVPPFAIVDLWAPSGPVFTPAGDAVTLLAIAVAVWLAYEGGMGRVRDRTPLGHGPERDASSP